MMFKTIPGIETVRKTFEVSNDGEIVRSVDKITGRVYELSQWNDKGYKSVSTPTGCPSGIHILVALAFLQKPQEADETWSVDHIDRNPENNNVDNLRWASKTSQLLNREKNCRVKIDACPVVCIDNQTGKVMKFKSAAEAEEKLYGVSYSSILKCLKDIKSYKTHAGYMWSCPFSDPDLPDELWKEFHTTPQYTVLFSQFGRIAYSFHNGYTKKLTAKQKNSDRQNKQNIYPSFSKNKKLHRFHRIIVDLFGEKIADGLIVHHKNNVKTDASFENLEITTISKNLTYAHDDGRYDLSIKKRIPILIKGIEYSSKSEAASKLNVSWPTINSRIHSENYPDYTIK